MNTMYPPSYGRNAEMPVASCCAVALRHKAKQCQNLVADRDRERWTIETGSERITLDFLKLAKAQHVPTSRKINRLLKLALRTYGLECKDVRSEKLSFAKAPVLPWRATVLTKANVSQARANLTKPDFCQGGRSPSLTGDDGADRPLVNNGEATAAVPLLSSERTAAPSPAAAHGATERNSENVTWFSAGGTCLSNRRKTRVGSREKRESNGAHPMANKTPENRHHQLVYDPDRATPGEPAASCTPAPGGVAVGKDDHHGQ